MMTGTSGGSDVCWNKKLQPRRLYCGITGHSRGFNAQGSVFYRVSWIYLRNFIIPLRLIDFKIFSAFSPATRQRWTVTPLRHLPRHHGNWRRNFDHHSVAASVSQMNGIDDASIFDFPSVPCKLSLDLKCVSCKWQRRDGEKNTSAIFLYVRVITVAYCLWGYTIISVHPAT